MSGRNFSLSGGFFLICMKKKKLKIIKFVRHFFIFILVNELADELVVYLFEIELKKARDTVPVKGLCHETNNFFDGLL